MLIHMTVSTGYCYKGVTFEWHNYLGPMILNRHSGEERPWRNIHARQWAQVSKFGGLSVEEQRKYMTY